MTFLLCSLLAACLSLSAHADPCGLGQSLSGGRIITGATTQRMVHFTFDDGPDVRTTPRLLDSLDALGIKVTFFFSASRFRGKEARNRQAADMARDALRRGHSVGSHSVDHQRMAKMNRAQVLAQLDENDKLFSEVFGERTFLFRPPFGSRNGHVDHLLQERGYTDVLWNIGLADWVKRSPEALARTFEKMLDRNEKRDGQLGGVVLLHDTHAWTVEAVPLMVNALRRRNCELQAQGALLYDIVDDLNPFFEPVGDAQPGIEARPAALPPQALEARQRRLAEQTKARCTAL